MKKNQDFAYVKTNAQISFAIAFLIQNFQLPTSFQACTARYVLDLVIKPHCWFSHHADHLFVEDNLIP